MCYLVEHKCGCWCEHLVKRIHAQLDHHLNMLLLNIFLRFQTPLTFWNSLKKMAQIRADDFHPTPMFIITVAFLGDFVFYKRTAVAPTTTRWRQNVSSLGTPMRNQRFQKLRMLNFKLLLRLKSAFDVIWLKLIVTVIKRKWSAVMKK